MNVIDFTPDLTAEWDAFVRDHPLASYGHLSAQFALAEATSGSGNASLALVEGSKLVGILPLFLTQTRALRHVPVRELTSGAFFPGGPLISPTFQGKAVGRALELLAAAVRHRADAMRADRVLVTYPTVAGGEPAISRFGYSPLLHHGYRARGGVGLLLDLSRTPEALAGERRSGCRQSIGKAQASGAIVRPITERSEWLSCYEINLQTLGPLAYSRQQMAAIWDHFIGPGHATAQAAVHGGAIAAVAVTVHFHGSAYYWIGLGQRPASIPGASHLALWTAILSARDGGCRHFELGSLEFENAKNIGISQFKQSFGGTPLQIVSAQLDARRVKLAAIDFAEALVSAVRERRQAAKGHRPEPAARRSPADATATDSARKETEAIGAA